MQAHIEHMHQLLRITLGRWHSNILASICNTRPTLRTLRTWFRSRPTIVYLSKIEVRFQDRASALTIHLRHPTTIVALVDLNATLAAQCP